MKCNNVKYTDDEVRLAMSWIKKQKKEQKDLLMRDFGDVDCRKMDDEQKLMWVILQLACRDELTINGRKQQVLMHMRGKLQHLNIQISSCDTQ